LGICWGYRLKSSWKEIFHDDGPSFLAGRGVRGDLGLIEYFDAPDVKRRIDEIIDLLSFDHIRPGSILCVRSRGSRAERTVARIHGLSRVWQKAMGLAPSYIIEIISERFDNLTEADQERTLIHEVLHIPHGFRGGFRPHKGYVNREIVETWYRRLQQQRRRYRREGGSS